MNYLLCIFHFDSLHLFTIVAQSGRFQNQLENISPFSPFTLTSMTRYVSSSIFLVKEAIHYPMMNDLHSLSFNFYSKSSTITTGTVEVVTQGLQPCWQMGTRSIVAAEMTSSWFRSGDPFEIPENCRGKLQSLESCSPTCDLLRELYSLTLWKP